MAQFFDSVGCAGWLAYPVLAAAWVHLPNGWVFSAKNGGWEYPVFLAIAPMALWLLGAGDYGLRRRGRCGQASGK